jgi:endonuclease YncB( thermonuclease family)
MTDFGSGYTGISLKGLPINEDILSFREEVLDDKRKRQELKDQLRDLEIEAQAELGSFETSDFMMFEKSVVEGMNTQRRDLRRVNLERFNIEIEDADSLILSRKGFFSWLFEDDILIRLAGIDAPEVGGHGVDPLEDIRWQQEQAGGEEAADFLRRRVAQAGDLDLVIATQGKTYGRYLGALVADAENVNIQLAEQGMVSALPFGDIEKDIVDRGAVARAERLAQREELGIHQMARYKAIELATEAAGRDITYNTLTRLDKLGQNLKLGRYATFLEGMGDEKRDLTETEVAQVTAMGHSLKNKYSRRTSGFQVVGGLTDSAVTDEIRQKMTVLNRLNAIGARSTNANRSGHRIQGFSESGVASAGRKQYGFGSPWQGIVENLNDIVGRGKDISSVVGYEEKRFKQEFAKRYKSSLVGMQEGGWAAIRRRSQTDFGSPWRGALALPKRLQKHFRESGMAVQDIDEFTKGIAGAIKTRKRLPFWGKSARRKEMQDLATFKSDLLNMSKEYDAPVVLNPRGMKIRRQTLKNQGFKVTHEQVERDVVQHERLHQTVRQFDLYDEMAAFEMPTSTRQEFLSKYDYSNRTVAKQNEEYLAMSLGSAELGQWQPLYDRGQEYLKQIDIASAMRHMNYEPVKTVRKTKTGWRKRFEQPFGTFFSASDDAWNKLKGLGKRGYAKALRKDTSDFGSGYRGLLNVPKVLADKMNLGLGRTSDIASLMKRTRGDISDLAGEFGKNYGGVWQKSPMAREVGEFYKGLKEASEAGFKDVMLVNPHKIKDLSAATGHSTTYITKHVIRHERLHLSRRLAAPGKQVNASAAPEEFHAALKSVGYNRGNTQSYGEEFLANLTANIHQPLNVHLSKTVLASETITMGTMEQTLKNIDTINAIEKVGHIERRKRMQASIALKKLKRAQMQKAGSRTVFNNARGGKNSRM